MNEDDLRKQLEEMAKAMKDIFTPDPFVKMMFDKYRNDPEKLKRMLLNAPNN